jgi:signal transduction histidine kinase
MTIRSLVPRVRERRLLLLRLLVYPYAVATLVLGPPGVVVTAREWVIALACATISLFGGRRPFEVLIAQSVILLYLRLDPGATAIGVVTPLVLVALVEVIARLNGRMIVFGIVLADLVIMLIVSQSTGFAPLPLIARMGIVIGGSILVGALIRTVRARIDEAEARAHEAELRRASETRAIRAEERTAIARELHDLVAHHLSSIVLRTGVARHVAPESDPRVVAVLDDVHTDASAALGDLRQLVSVLRDPERVDEGPGAPLIDGADLHACIDEIAERIRQSGLSVVVNMDPDVAQLDTVRRLAVLRLSQEGLTNALRHASGATRADLIIQRGTTGEVRVEVIDDGVAASHRRAGEGAGHGLAGMRERVELVGGRFAAGPGDHGWRVSAELPASADGDPVGAA